MNAELIKVLRCEMYGDDECDKSDCPIWSELGCRNGIANRAAADALEAADKRIAELEAQLKDGEWEKAKPRGIVSYADGYAECSCCHNVVWLGWKMKFCPECGAKMKKGEEK